MKKRHNLRAYFLGVLTALLVMVCAVPAVALTATKTIKVNTGIRVFVDDKELIPKDATGKQVDVFLYNGTNYLPARAISEALGKPVQWDGSLGAICIGKHSSTKPAAYLSQMDYFTKQTNFGFDTLTKDNLGNAHTHSIKPAVNQFEKPFITYKLNGQYSRLTASYYMLYEYRDKKYQDGCTLVIYGDGHELWRGSVNGGEDPLDIDVDLNGVLELTLEYHTESGLAAWVTGLGDVALWS